MEMTEERFALIVAQVCEVIGLPDVDEVLRTRMIGIEGFEVHLDYFDDDLDAIYTNFHFGAVTAGRTLVIFRLMLEANLLIYAQDQAQLALDTDTGGIVLILRLPVDDYLSGQEIVDLLVHYADHGRYWRQNIIDSSDEMFEGIASGDFSWIRA